DRLFAETGLMGYLIYPFNFFTRVEGGLGYRYRDVPQDLFLDARQYLRLTRRSNLAFRVWGASSEGNQPRPYFFGGVDIYSLVGDHAFYANSEFRFPLIDLLATPLFNIRNVRGLVFVDVAGAYFDEVEEFDFWDSDENRLQDALSSYGLGVSAEIFGLPVHWTFSKRWDLKDTFSDFDTSFWIGQTF
ncbi:MAG TPA: hypothetical protein VJG13_00475, partial [Thermoanaerobaculia bacterium]|nr:hypothetical protein [Thermoanaerobaculia bacterium]